MADELNIPTHRYYEPRNNIALAPSDISKQWIYNSGIQKIDAWINSQPWANTVYLSFIPSGSTGMLTADSLVFKVPLPQGEWFVNGSTILQSPTPPNAANYRIVGTIVEVI